MAASRTALSLTSLSSYSKDIATRAVHIKMQPRPYNLSESRQILRVLQRYGEVVVFRNLKYEVQNPAPNSALAIFKSASSVERLLGASPLRFELRVGEAEGLGVEEPIAETAVEEKGLGVEEQGRKSEDEAEEEGEEDVEDRAYRDRLPTMADITASPTYQDLAGSTKWGNTFSSYQPSPASPKTPPPRTRKLHPPPPPPPPPAPPQTPPPPPQSHPTREVQLTILPSLLDHQAYIRRQGYYAGFNPNTRTVMGADLDARVPLRGLADVSLGMAEVPLRVRLRRERERERGERWVRKGLKEMWEEGVRGGEGRVGGENRE